MAEPGHPPALRFAAVGKRFGSGARQVAALSDLTLSIPAGRITGLLGPDAAGKTTLLRLAAGLLRPDAGRLDVLGLDAARDAARIQARIGYMPQRFGLYEDLSVQENLDLYAQLQGLTPAERPARYAELLRLTALGPFGHRRAGALSGGMKQKLGLACTLLRVPELLLLDEPTVGVDPISRRELWAIIANLRTRGVTVLVSTSYLDEAERCDQVVLMDAGRLLVQGQPHQLAADLQGRCFAVRHVTLDRRVLQQRLLTAPGVTDVRLEGTGVRALLAAAAVPPPLEGSTWQPATPEFADVFVDRLQARQARRVALQVAQAAATDKTDKDVVLHVARLNRFFDQFHAVNDVSFDVVRGEVFGLLGANGAGKTTTFRMLCGLLPASSGELRVVGQDLRTAPAEARRQIGYVAQKFALYGNLSVAQNLAFFAAAYGLRKARLRARLDWALAEFELGPYLDRNAGDIPLGYKQRLALACALLHEPPILFLDEPTSGVDPLARSEFWQRINQYAAAGTTVLITTHFMDEAEYCDRLVLMSQGSVLASGTPADIRARAASPDVPNPTMEDAFISLIAAHEANLRRAA
ncbi:ATP-binding cassette domain-containing protein [Rhodopila globiformis]|uniref:ATP-binding cassette domain-containing protein n=1 Tax=Rhodopila globiformis TaxID=1071 RepID=UPI001EFC7DCF|nr:ATP-binding cassette domain-containing protein [Rhodopila globiformis]